MFLGEYKDSALGRVWVPDEFTSDQIGMLPGFVCDRFGRKLFLDTLDGWVHEYEEQEIPGESLEGFFSKILSPIKRVFKKIATIPKKLHQATMKQLSKINERRKKITKSVLKNKYARQVVRVAGAVFAPFTGGLSLAAAEAAARYGKARYVQGMERSSAFKRGAVGAVIGYVGGRAISAGFSAVQKGGVSALNPFAAKSAAVATQGAGAAAGTGTGIVTGTSASTGGLWSTVGSTALKVGAKLAPTIASTLLSARGAPGGSMQEVIYGEMPGADPYGYGAATMPDYGAYADAGGYENAFAPGGSTVVPDGLYDDEGNLIDAEQAAQMEMVSKFAPLAILAVGAIASVFLLRGKKRGRR